MLSDVSPWHIFIFVVLALLVVGPKDLPAMLRKVGQFTAKLRGMANEFRASFDEMSRQSELDELRKEVDAMRAATAKPVQDLRNAALQFHDDMVRASGDVQPGADPTAIKAAPVMEPVPTTAAELPAPTKKKAAGKANAGKAASAKAKPAAKKAAPQKAGPKKAAPKKVRPKTAAAPESGQ